MPLQTYHKVRVVVSCAEDLGFDDQLAGFRDFSTTPPSSPVSICREKEVRTHVTDLIQEMGCSDSQRTLSKRVFGILF
jgi:hypothetical protein